MDRIKMIKVYTLLSGDKPIGEIRSDGRSYEVFNDKTDGRIDLLGQNNFAQLQQAVSESSYLNLIPKYDGLPGVLRYTLDSGDVVEATTDGVTALLNGNLLPLKQKDAMMRDIMTGAVVVTSKQALSKPMAIVTDRAIPQAQDLKPDLKQSEKLDKWSAAAMANEPKKSGSEYYDPAIENMDMGNVEWPEKVKNMAYYLIHGSFKKK